MYGPALPCRQWVACVQSSQRRQRPAHTPSCRAPTLHAHCYHTASMTMRRPLQQRRVQLHHRPQAALPTSSVIRTARRTLSSQSRRGRGSWPPVSTATSTRVLCQGAMRRLPLQALQAGLRRAGAAMLASLPEDLSAAGGLPSTGSQLARRALVPGCTFKAQSRAQARVQVERAPCTCASDAVTCMLCAFVHCLAVVRTTFDTVRTCCGTSPFSWVIHAHSLHSAPLASIQSAAWYVRRSHSGETLPRDRRAPVPRAAAQPATAQQHWRWTCSS